MIDFECGANGYIVAQCNAQGIYLGLLQEDRKSFVLDLV